MVFVYLFTIPRYSKKRTLVICALSFAFTTAMSQLKMIVLPDNALFYFIITIIQIIAAQLTGLLISERRNAKTLFVGLSASNYVLVGSIIASILYIFTDNIIVSLTGNLLAHIIILLIFYRKIRTIILRFCERDMEKNGWEICLIPIFFYCAFPALPFSPILFTTIPKIFLSAFF